MNILLDVPTELSVGFDMLRSRLEDNQPRGRKATDEELDKARRMIETDGLRAANAYLKAINNPAGTKRPSRRALMVEALWLGLEELLKQHAPDINMPERHGVTTGTGFTMATREDAAKAVAKIKALKK